MIILQVPNYQTVEHFVAGTAALWNVFKKQMCQESYSNLFFFTRNWLSVHYGKFWRLKRNPSN